MGIVFPRNREELKSSPIFHKVNISAPIEVWVNKNISSSEINSYINYANSKYVISNITHMMIYIEDSNYVSMNYFFKDTSFKRIRRITGYLVGDLNRFNNAKYAEVKDRIKHGA